ncbi:plastocyanin/azurin family copper-binding protein [Patulibacter sp. NPDC049589]|uniref:cupredoxin domain-containing protein n=1 Tax=Patulibacter sp. NPDC049589 TaxID=3154731 RepID=UPI0034395F3C
MRTRILTASAAAVSTVAVIAVLAVPGSDAAATKTVEVDDFHFSPASVTVKRNTTVKWIWVGKAEHDVEVVKGPKDFHSKVMTTGSYTKKFTKKGTYRIDCSIHSSIMKMVVKVK